MRIFLISFFVLLHTICFCAARFWVGGGSSNAWNATTPTNWSATSGGSNNASVPGASDDATFNGLGAAGNAASTVSANFSCLSLTFTSGYTATVTQNTGTVITIAGNFTDNTAHGWTVNGTGSITINTTSTIASGGKTYPGAVSFTTATTKTLSGNDWTIGGALSTTNAQTINGQTLICAGLTAGAAVSGTTVLQFSGGTWSGSQQISNNITFAGNVTVSGSVLYTTGTITYTSGTITTTGSTITLNGSCTFNTNGMSWNNITTAATTPTFTLNSLLTATGTFTIAATNAITFAGTAGFTVGTLTINNSSTKTHTFVHGNTYTITTAFNCNTLTPALVILTSDDGTLTAAITLQAGATCNVDASFTRINASGGRTIWTWNGTVTSCSNINVFTDLKTVTKSFVQ